LNLVIVQVRRWEERWTEAEALVEVIDHADEATGFTAMERGTGWSAAIVAEMMARRQTPLGAGGVDQMVPARLFVDELKKRGIPVAQRVT
jgi:lysine 6-dehydrogenase